MGNLVYPKNVGDVQGDRCGVAEAKDEDKGNTEEGEGVTSHEGAVKGERLMVNGEGVTVRG
jgi:hypothetical protein